MSMVFVDTHAHYDDERFQTEFDGGTDGALRYVHANGIAAVVNIGANVASSAASVSLAERYPFVYAAVGIHPSDAQQIPADRWQEALYTIRTLAAHQKVVAIGEIGLDYHYDNTDRSLQIERFHDQMRLAASLSLPVMIHDRDAHGDTFDVLCAYPSVTGILHSYSGSAEMAKQLVARGWYISFSGPVSYKNAARVKEACAIVPEDRLLLETDAPYLPPVPFRGQLNHSALLPYTAAAMAQIRGVTTEEIAEWTVRNAVRFLGIRLTP